MKTVHRMSFKYLEIISFQNKHVAFPDNNAETSYKCITSDLKTKMSTSMLYLVRICKNIKNESVPQNIKYF